MGANKSLRIFLQGERSFVQRPPKIYPDTLDSSAEFPSWWKFRLGSQLAGTLPYSLVKYVLSKYLLNKCINSLSFCLGQQDKFLFSR